MDDSCRCLKCNGLFDILFGTVCENVAWNLLKLPWKTIISRKIESVFLHEKQSSRFIFITAFLLREEHNWLNIEPQ
jgi:hypothetical protein